MSRVRAGPGGVLSRQIRHDRGESRSLAGGIRGHEAVDRSGSGGVRSRSVPGAGVRRRDPGEGVPPHVGRKVRHRCVRIHDRCGAIHRIPASPLLLRRSPDGSAVHPLQRHVLRAFGGADAPLPPREGSGGCSGCRCARPCRDTLHRRQHRGHVRQVGRVPPRGGPQVPFHDERRVPAPAALRRGRHAVHPGKSGKPLPKVDT